MFKKADNIFKSMSINAAKAHEKGYFWDKKILYVHPTYGDTYPIINQGIIEELKKMVREVYTVTVEQDVATLAGQIKPDLVLVLLGDTFPIDQVKSIREMDIKTAVWFTDDPYVIDVTTNIAPYYEYVFTQELSCVPYYQMQGCPQVHYLPLAVNTTVFQLQKENTSVPIDVLFMGAGWNNRITLFDQIAPYLANKKTLIVGSFWDRMENFHLLSDKIRFGFLSSEESARLINQSKIVINNHRSYDDSTFFNRNSKKIPAISINPRTFEIFGCCTFQLSDVRQELHRYFEVGKDIETYSSSSELIEKIDYYLSHEDERNAIARRGYEQTVKNHTYSKRLEFLLHVIF
jgi:spore maturation protein CgeB